VACAYSEAGGRLVLIDRDHEGLGVTLEACNVEGTPGGHIAEVCDVTDEQAVASVFDESSRRVGPIDVLFNNAGIEGQVAAIDDYAIDEFTRVLEVNVIGAWLCLKHAVKNMGEAGGAIVNTASAAGSLASLPGSSAYVASKHAVLGLTRNAAAELVGRGIRVNAVLPGPVDTRMMRSLEGQIEGMDAGQARALFSSNVPMNRYATASEVAAMVLFLSTSASSYITGGAYCVDGGFSAV